MTIGQIAEDHGRSYEAKAREIANGFKDAAGNPSWPFT
jgi:plasmid stability protein